MKNKTRALSSLVACFGAVALMACGETGGTTSETPAETDTSDAAEDTGSSLPPSSSSTINYDDYTYEYYENAIYPRLSNGSSYTGEAPDPAFVKGDDGYYYIFTTGSGGGQCFRSTDYVNWELYLSPVIPRPTWGDGSGGNTPNVWAPDVVKIGDQWIYYYSLSGWDNPIGVGYATADSIAGPWTDQGKLFTWQEIDLANAIDPCIYIEDDGRVFMAVGSFQGIDLIELDPTGTALLNGAEYQKENKVLIAGTYGAWNSGGFEGSYIIKVGEYYYYFGSHGNCCTGITSSYNVVVARATSIDGPYYDDQGRPITNNLNYGTMVVRASVLADSSQQQVAGPGHCSVFTDDAGQYWLCYHSYVERDNFSERHLMIDKLLWTEDGWPYVENYQPSYGEEKEGPLMALN